MDPTSRKQHYLAKAKDAEREAGKCKVPDMRDAWLKVAQSYISLAGGSSDEIHS
jgi:hypothetical protein